MIAKINEAKKLVKYISCDCKCKFDSTTYNSNQKWNDTICQCDCKKYCMCKKDYSWNPSICICDYSKNLKSIVGDSIIVWDKIISVTNSVPTNLTNNI